MLKKLLIVAMCIAILGSIGIGCKTTATDETTAAVTTAAAAYIIRRNPDTHSGIMRTPKPVFYGQSFRK